MWLLLGRRPGSEKDRATKCFLSVLFNLYRYTHEVGTGIARKENEGIFHVNGVAPYPDWGLGYVLA